MKAEATQQKTEIILLGNEELMHTELPGGNWTHNQFVETGHQVKEWVKDLKNKGYFLNNNIWSYTNQIKIIKSHTAAHKLIAPESQSLPLFLSFSSLWSNFLALRTVFMIYSKCCCQSSIPLGRRKGTKPPTTPLLSTKDLTPTISSFLGFGQ